ncbi:hypothetical protein FJ251_13705 [bacterium]|nr:hypothetical protein [bacterium]
MGGPGSGRGWRCDSKPTTDEYLSLDVRVLARKGMLRPGAFGVWQWKRGEQSRGSISTRAEPGRVLLIYRHRQEGGDWKDESYPVFIERTPCHFGGSRPWFVCPAAGCGRRVAILYGGGVFACRRCHKLAYGSTREDEGDRAVRAANRLRRRLGWKPGILNEPGDKPKWMRWETFEREAAQHDRLVEESLRVMARRLGLLTRFFPK